MDRTEAQKKAEKKYRETHRTERNKYSKTYYGKHSKNEDYKKLRNERTIRYYYANKIKALARNAVSKAIRKVVISKNDFCCLCGSTKYIQAHHDDYNKPLDIKWVCRSCHYKISHQALADIKEKLENKANNERSE